MVRIMTVLHRLSCKRVFIHGGYGIGNVGDEAVIAGILEKIRTMNHDCEVIVSSYDPRETAIRYGVKSVKSWTLQALRWIAGSDVVLIGGGLIVGPLLKYGRSALYRLLSGKFCLVSASIGKLLGKDVHFISIGVEDYPDIISKILLAPILNRCNTVSVRDTLSRDVLQRHRVSKHIAVAIDPAFHLSTASDSQVKRIFAKNDIPLDKKLIGLSARSLKDPILNEKILRSLYKTVNWLLGIDVDHCVVYFPHWIAKKSYSTFDDDLRTYQLLKDRMNANANERFKLLGDNNPRNVKAAYSFMKFSICMRYHSVIFNEAVGTPYVAIEYAPKVTALLTAFNKRSFGLPLDQLSFQSLRDLITEKLLKSGSI